MVYTVFISERCKYCLELLPIVKDRNDVNVVNVDKVRAPQWVNSVPTMIDEHRNVTLGKDIFAKFKKEIEGYEFMLSGGNDFSFIEEGYAERSSNFSFIGQEQVEEGNNETKEMMENLVAKRNQEVAQPIQRI